ncbi:TonB-dependent receptor [Psychroserpens mesophilus]|uniref:TonB-dependent receptor n=1 Tax=Psychroserpens mesophilus TaxID=325473 RepID=UPI003F49AF01
MDRTNLYIFLMLCIVPIFKSQGQHTDKKVPITEVLEHITNEHAIIFNYESSLLEDVTVIPLPQDLSLSAKIKNLEKQSDLIFEKVSDLVYSIYKPLRLCGYLKDSELNLPLLGATIKSKSFYAFTDENGYFEIDLKSSTDLLTIRHIGFKTIEQVASFFNLDNCETIVMTEEKQAISPIVITGYIVRGIDKRQDGSTSIDYSEFTLLPGLIESDVLQTVQALPGVMSVDETVSNINIRGGSHDQNLILWDDIKMYQSGHFFGLISGFNPHITQTATVITNGTDASLSDGVSGTIDMQSNKHLESTFNGSFGVNLLNADLFLDVPLNVKSSVQIAARKSTDELLRTPTYETYFDRVTQDTEAQNNVENVSNSNQEFDFYDTSLRWLYKPSDKDEIRLNFILINNELNFDETAVLNGKLETRTSNVSQNSIAGGINYKRTWNSNLSSTLHIYNTDYKLQAINANVLAEQRYLQENTVSETAIKLENLYQLNVWKFILGYNFVESEVVNLNDIDLPRFVRRDEEVLREHAAFGQAWYNDSNTGLSIRGGIRANYLTKFETLIVEPRFGILKTIGNYIEVEALGEFKHQNVSQIVNFQNDFLGIEKRRWQPTDNDSIPILRSKQASLGVLYKNKGWLIDARVYYKHVDGITTQSQSFTTKYEIVKEKGSYDALGFECLFRKNFNNFSNWLSYSYITNTYTFDTLEEIEFPSNFDITHSISVGSTFSNEHWNISAGLNYRTGKPTSIPEQGNEIIDDNVNFDQANTNRLQDYLRIDASALYKFKLNNSLRSEIGASVWNISNRENAINNYYRINQNDDVNKFTRYSLGLTTNAVVRLYF